MGDKVNGFEGWKAGIDRADGEWDHYDSVVMRVVGEYNVQLRDTPGFFPVDWRLVKAMLWTESGANVDAWRTKPLQIGVGPDPGLRALLLGQEGGDLILPPCVVLTTSNVLTNPHANIRAGVGYMLIRMANYGFATMPDDSSVFSVSAGPGDSFSALARKHRSTVDTLQKLNPGIRSIRAGQILKCQRASVRKTIVGWKTFDVNTVARRYNGNGQPTGDSFYARKLEYAMIAIKKRNPR
jgi:hypothetical protein